MVIEMVLTFANLLIYKSYRLSVFRFFFSESEMSTLVKN